IFNRDFRKLGEDWTKRPITLTMANIQNSGQSAEVQKSDDDSLLTDARNLIELRKLLIEEEGRLAEETLREVRMNHINENIERLDESV
ncbi:MAG: phage portal protein, partial [Deltaproteobacteria bacterium]|nr:phage portal protein [Deltaproteobacteria bacterium]